MWPSVKKLILWARARSCALLAIQIIIRALRAISCGLRAISCGPRERSCGLRERSCGLRERSCGLRERSCGLYMRRNEEPGWGGADPGGGTTAGARHWPRRLKPNAGVRDRRLYYSRLRRSLPKHILFSLYIHLFDHHGYLFCNVNAFNYGLLTPCRSLCTELGKRVKWKRAQSQADCPDTPGASVGWGRLRGLASCVHPPPPIQLQTYG